MLNKVLTIAFALVIAIGFTQVNMAKAQHVTDGLVAYWPFEAYAADGVSIDDVVGPNDGTPQDNDTPGSGPEIVPDGKVGNALFFDSLDNVDCGNDPSLTLTDGLTIEYWLKWDGATYSPTVGKESSYKNMIKTSGSLIFNMAAAGHGWGGVTMGYEAPANEWVHIATTYDGSQMLLYVNGEQTGVEEPATGAVSSSDKAFRLGAYGVPVYCASPGVDCRSLHGYLDEVRVYDRGLSAAEIAQNAAITTTAVSPDKKLVETWGKIKL